MEVEPALWIRDAASLQEWRRQLRLFTLSRNLPKATFQLAAWTEGRNRSVSALALGLQHACGCASSGAFMGAAALVTAAGYFWSGGRVSAIHLKQVLSAAGVVLLAGLVGKLLGLFWARWRLIKLAAAVHDALLQQEGRKIPEPV